MDRQISRGETGRSTVFSILKYLFIIALIVLAFWFVRGLLVKKADRDKLHIVSVERGEMQNTLTATGVVVPSFEREINAPVSTEIKRVARSNGEFVEANDLILELDQEFTRLEFDQLNDELELRRNSIDKLKLEFDKNLKDLDYQDQIKQLQLDELEAQVKDQKRLNEVGGATEEEVEQAELQLKVARLEKSILENELTFRRSVNVNDKKNLELEYKIQENRLAELKRKLRETNVRAPQAGVITWVNEDLGRKVQEGEALVRIANLESFKVEASSADRNSNRIEVGQPVRVRINQQNLEGEIATILPAVENNTIRFNVILKNPDAEILRPNIRAEVYIITDQKEDVLRVRNGPAFRGASSQFVYVVEGDRAVRRRVQKGLVNSDFVEIVANLAEGDRVIISNMEDYDHLDEFMIKAD